MITRPFPSQVLLALAVSTHAFGYDYVVIGGGAGGLTLASRLSENPSVSVALIKAGFNVENLTEVLIPGMVGSGIDFTTLDWGYPTVPQKNLNGRTVKVSAGNALGGSTVINNMIFPEAGKQQYDARMKLNNDTQWGWDGLSPFLNKSEKLWQPPNVQIAEKLWQPPNVHVAEKLWQPINIGVALQNFRFNQSTLWMEASKKLGFIASSVSYYDGGPHAQAVRVPPNFTDTSNNTRCSAACVYCIPFAGRPNPQVYLNSTVTRILWSNTTLLKGLAAAVEYIKGNQTHRLTVEKEVILAAGTIGSPKILELSGVGNQTILKSAGIEPYIDLPTVGENLADHCHSFVSAFTNLTLTKDQLLLNTSFAEEQLALWYKNRTGLYSAAPRTLGIAVPSNIFNSSTLSSLVERARLTQNSVASTFSNGNADLAKGISMQLSLALDLYQEDKELPLEMSLEPGYSGPTSFADRPPRTYITIQNVHHAPLSRGRTHITSNDSTAFPAVDPAHLSHPLDIATHVAGIKMARKMLTTAPMDSIYQGEFEPGSDKQTDQEIEDWLRGAVQSGNRETGSLSMMPKELGGVVDTSLRVYGLSNVRVADASIIPFPVGAHLSSTVYAIGEKAADLIQRNA